MKNGREKAYNVDIFYLQSQSVYFTVQQESNPSRTSVTYWRSSGRVSQILSSVTSCMNVVFDEETETLLLTCSANEVNSFSFQNN